MFMYRFRFGTLFALLNEIKNTSNSVYHNQQDFYAALVDPKAKRPLAQNISYIISGENPKRSKIRDDDITDIALTSVDQLTAHYQSKIIPYLKQTMLKPLVLAIREILENDTYIHYNQVFILNECTKENLLNNNVIYLAKVLACLVKYLIEKPNVKEDDEDVIPKHFVSTFTAKNEELNKLLILTSDEEVETKLTKTVYTNNFEETFKEFNADTYSLNLSNTSRFKVYVLDIYEPNILDTLKLKIFIIDNIANYIYSRTNIKKEESKGNIRSLGYKSIFELKERAGTTLTEVFSQIMIYSFMEAGLNAPKLYSAYELKTLNNDLKINISGIYLLPHGSVDNSNNQLVFGSSNVNNKLESAINNVLETAKTISLPSFKIRRFLDSSVSSNRDYDETTIQFIKKVLMPSKDDIPIVNSFGIFFSYSIDTSHITTSNINDYRAQIKDEINTEISNVLPYIETKIKELDLDKYPFYFFILPLINAEEISSQLLKEIFEVR